MPQSPSPPAAPRTRRKLAPRSLFARAAASVSRDSPPRAQRQTRAARTSAQSPGRMDHVFARGPSKAQAQTQAQAQAQAKAQTRAQAQAPAAEAKPLRNVSQPKPEPQPVGLQTVGTGSSPEKAGREEMPVKALPQEGMQPPSPQEKAVSSPVESQVPPPEQSTQPPPPQQSVSPPQQSVPPPPPSEQLAPPPPGQVSPPSPPLEQASPPSPPPPESHQPPAQPPSEPSTELPPLPLSSPSVDVPLPPSPPPAQRPPPSPEAAHSPRRRRAPPLYGRARVGAVVGRGDRVLSGRDARRPRRSVVARFGEGGVLWAYLGGERGVDKSEVGGEWGGLDAWAVVGRGRRREVGMQRGGGSVRMKAEGEGWVVEVVGKEGVGLNLAFREKKRAEEWRDGLLLRVLSWEELAEESTAWLVADLFPKGLGGFCVAGGNAVEGSESVASVASSRESERGSVISDITAASGEVEAAGVEDVARKGEREEVEVPKEGQMKQEDPFGAVLAVCSRFDGDLSIWLLMVLKALGIGRAAGKRILKHLPLVAAAVQVIGDVLSAIVAAGGKPAMGVMTGGINPSDAMSEAGWTDCASVMTGAGRYGAGGGGGMITVALGKMEGLSRAREDVLHVAALALVQVFAAAARGERGGTFLSAVRLAVEEVEAVGGDVAAASRAHVLAGGADGAFDGGVLRRLTELRYRLTCLREEAASRKTEEVLSEVSDGGEVEGRKASGVFGKKRVRFVGEGGEM